ncbi:hypothetical protein GJ496_004952 [Pomphorhynchus laevis]|nr:hypothetical protein GJ496_004952 [Pomphorhynchus laevis]
MLAAITPKRYCCIECLAAITEITEYGHDIIVQSRSFDLSQSVWLKDNQRKRWKPGFITSKNDGRILHDRNSSKTQMAPC